MSTRPSVLKPSSTDTAIPISAISVFPTHIPTWGSASSSSTTSQGYIGTLGAPTNQAKLCESSRKGAIASGIFGGLIFLVVLGAILVWRSQRHRTLTHSPLADRIFISPFPLPTMGSRVPVHFGLPTRGDFKQERDDILSVTTREGPPSGSSTARSPGDSVSSHPIHLPHNALPAITPSSGVSAIDSLGMPPAYESAILGPPFQWIPTFGIPRVNTIIYVYGPMVQVAIFGTLVRVFAEKCSEAGV